MEFTRSRKVAVILIVIGILMLLGFELFAPYCAKNICGCTSDGILQWTLLQPGGGLFLLLGFVLMI